MYSPKISEDLIPMLFQIKQVQGNKPMTKIVDEILRPQVVKLHEKLINYNPIHKEGEHDGIA